MNELFKLMAHTLGVDPKESLPESFLRNKFVAGDDHSDISILKYGQEQGYMSCTAPLSIFGNSRMWYVTELGVEFFKNNYEALRQA